MSESAKSTANMSLDEAIRRTPGPGTWAGRSIMIRHVSDGRVIATTRGLMAVATTEGAALLELARLVKVAERTAQDGTVTNAPLATASS
jgi:hypothetical protein